MRPRFFIFIGLTASILLLSLFIVGSSPTPTASFTLPTLVVLPSLTPSPQAAVTEATPASQSQNVAISASVLPSTEMPVPTDTPSINEIVDVIATSPTIEPILADTVLPQSPLAPIPVIQPVVVMSQQPMIDQVIIQFAASASAQERDAYVQQLGGTVLQDISALDVIVVQVPQAIAEQPLPDSSIVEVSEPDYYVSALISAPTSDIHYAEQWALPAIGVLDAWLDLPEDASTMLVAVIDSGVCADHPDLAGVILVGWDYVEDDEKPQDVSGHGCGVAGIIAAQVDNGEGIAGVAPNARILPLRVLNGSGLGLYSDVAAAMNKESRRIEAVKPMKMKKRGRMTSSKQSSISKHD